MPRTVIMDFETFYDKDYSLRKLSYPEYIHDERFKVHALGIKVGGKKQFILPADIADTLPQYQNDIVVGHNLFFDAAILAWKYNFRPAYFLDTLLLANHVLGTARDTGSRNDLDSLATRLELPVGKGSLEFLKGIREATPGDLLKLQEYLFTDLDITDGVLRKLLPDISNRDFELWLLDHTLRIYTDKHLLTDPAKIAATIKLVEARRSERVAAAGVNNIILSSNPKFAEELKLRLARNKVKLPTKLSAPSKKDGKRKMIPALAKQDPAFLKLAEHPVAEIANLVRGRLVERSATVALARLRVMEKFRDRGIPVHLVYYGAHTGRFAAGGGFNFQNLTSPDRATDPVDREIASAIRASIVAGEGQVFVAVDAAQIEARVVAWLAGQMDVLETFASGADIYSVFISGVLKQDVHKPKGDEPKDVQQALKLKRGLGKEAVLGLGFNMGVDKFITRLDDKVPGWHGLVPKGQTPTDFAAGIVAGYRESNDRIVNFWADLNDVFKAAFFGRPGVVGLLDIQREEPGVVSITLPSSRKLYYRDVRSEKSEGSSTFTGIDGQSRTIERKGRELRHGNGQKIYGGLLAENVTQAVARDILVENGIWAAEQAGYPVVLHVHDEVVCRVPEAKGPEVLAFLVKSLSTPPSWGAGLVLGAEGSVKKNLGK